MSRDYHLNSALLTSGWAEHVRLTVGDDGRISALSVANVADSASVAGAEVIEGTVIPGMGNAHSHAFQRAIAGRTEFRSSSRDSFWTWRQAMYSLANRIEPEDLQLLALQLFVEMLKAGYTSVAEFHYLHRRLDGTPYEADNALWDAVAQAAQDAGIALTFLPTLYQTSDFGARPLRADQARFAMQTDAFLRAIEKRVAAERRSGNTMLRTGAAFHSLRAVPLDSLHSATLGLRGIDAAMPIHIHVAEQMLEVKACRRETGQRPVELLMATGLVTDFWCLVHATHCTAAELQSVAAARAAICVSISTEANLGDGVFDTARFRRAGGQLCVGSDSQSTVSPTEELRWLEYQQRLRKKRRVVLATAAAPHVGTQLWQEAAACSAHAMGQPGGAIGVGRRADWLVLDPRHPNMAGAAADFTLDHLLFGGGDSAISDVMVAGRWVVRQGRHASDGPRQERFARLMERLARPE